MEKFVITESKEASAYITYIYNAVMNETLRMKGKGELVFGERTALLLTAPAAIGRNLSSAIAEIVGIGYKYNFLRENLHVALSRREKKLLCAALIAADLDGDCAFIRRKITSLNAFALDGFYDFRLSALREKWKRIVEYIPNGFASPDLLRFCEFLVGESRNKIYLRGKTVFGENFVPLRRSRLMGEEDIETEIILSDAGFVYCLGEVEDSLGDFLQKYFAERAIFS